MLPDSCLRCGGEGWTEGEEQMLLCPVCHGSGDRPAARAPKGDPSPEYVEIHVWGGAVVASLPKARFGVSPNGVIVDAFPRPIVRFLGVDLDARTFAGIR